MHADFFNPKFVYHSPVHSDELVASGILTRNRVAAHVDHAIAALNAADGSEPRFAGDARVEYLNPIARPETFRIDLWVEELSDWSCTYGFICSSEDGLLAYARGERTVVNVDPASQRPSRWNAAFRVAHESLLRELPAYA
jgi:acyl-CoA thioester hydrolase